MDGSGENFRWLKSVKTIEVPFFQRPYVWDNDNFNSLIESFLEAPGNTMPFFGSSILKRTDEEDEYLIIDGQQRITTFSILIRVLMDVVEEKNIGIAPAVKSDLRDCIYSIDVDDDGEETYELKLKPSHSDEKAFEMIMDTSVARPLDLTTLGNEPIYQAYSYFYNYFSDDSKVDITKLFCLKLYNKTKSLIFIILDSSDDEQKIFDSVNSLGRTLSNSDIIKNYLFQKMKELSKKDKAKEKQVIDSYYKYWDTIFYADDKKNFWYTKITLGRITTDHLECFLKDLGVIKGLYIAKVTTGANGLCKAYKSYIDSLSLPEITQFIKEINEYAKVYYTYKTEYQSCATFKWDDYVSRLLLIMDCLDTSTFNPYILKILKETPDDMKDKLYRLEKFFLTRFLYEGTSKNYNKCCQGLIGAKDDAAYFQRYMLESPVVNGSYKNKIRKLTNAQGRLLLFLIEMLNRRGNEKKYSDTLKITSYSLEHVMPQKWAKDSNWYQVECYDADGNKVDKNDTELFFAVRNSAVKSIGNFALLTASLNTTVSNSAFPIKIDGNGKHPGIRDFAANLTTTKAIIDQYDSNKIWNEITIFEKEAQYFSSLNSFYHFE